MKSGKQIVLTKKLKFNKPVINKPLQKDISSDDEKKHPDFSQTSVFHSISGIMRMPTSGLSHTAVLEARNTIQTLIRGTDNIGDLIEDGKTTLVFREFIIETSQPDITNKRFIIYQKPDSEGQIKIRSTSVDEAKTEIDDNEPFVFRQCTFFLCDTREKKNPNSSYLSVGIRIATEEKVCFIDCAFVAVSYINGGTKTTGVDYMVFTDCFSKINLELENCYFSGPKSVMYTNFAVRSLVMNQCSFDGMEADALHITHPGKLIVTGCQFYHCKSQTINIKLFDQDNQDRQIKKTSGFANSTKIENSVVNWGYFRGRTTKDSVRTIKDKPYGTT